MARRFVRSGRRTGPRRATFWETNSTTAIQTLTGGGTESAVNVMVTEAELDNIPNPTLIRIRGHVFQQLGNAADGSGDSVLIAHAIMVVDAKQLAAGLTAMPLSLSSNSEDFLWADSAYLANTTVTTFDSSQNWKDIVIDSKSMRKITLNQVLVMVTEMDVQAGGGVENVRFGFQMRLLFKK